MNADSYGPDDVVIITNDLILHRAFQKGSPVELSAFDAELLAKAKGIMTLDEVTAHEAAKLRATPMDDRPVMESEGGGTFVTMTPEMLEEAAKKIPEHYRGYLTGCLSVITGKAMAALVRTLRVDEGHSWRSVAAWMDESGFVNVGDGDPQLIGRALCELSADQLGEDFDAPPWNVV